MYRRDFIKSGCGYCAGLAAVSVLGSLLEGCTPSDLIFKTQRMDGIINVPLLNMEGKKYLIVREPQLEYDLLLVKDNEIGFHTLAMQCTHRQQPLVVTSTGLTCNEHGSRFDLEGKVLQDPATRPLAKFTTELRETNIVIHL
jgi:nitrite reductase/ring-hydroxylating ferredoxin subunit